MPHQERSSRMVRDAVPSMGDGPDFKDDFVSHRKWIDGVPPGDHYISLSRTTSLDISCQGTDVTMTPGVNSSRLFNRKAD